MDRTALVWWGVGALFAIGIVTMSVPHIAKEEGPLSVFLFGSMIGAALVYGVIDHQRKKERAKRELERDRG